MSNPMIEAKKIQDVISRIIGVQFEITNIEENRPNSLIHPLWYMSCLEITQASKIPYVNSLWREGGEIWVESLTIDNSSQLIELTYGEEAAARSSDLGFESEEFQLELHRDYPIVFQKIQRYKSIANQVSERRKVQLELKKEGAEGIVDFTFVAKIMDTDDKSLENKLRANVEALKEAYQQATLS
jgi:hypothetical protein